MRHGNTTTVRTPRLVVRQPTEHDRTRFVELFCDPKFMVFGELLGPEQAHQRFDGMLADCARVRFAKQPIVLHSSGEIVGYAGVAPMWLAGRDRLEFGWRLVPEVRGRGIATEAVRAMLAVAAVDYVGEIFAVIDPDNRPSANVARKVGFTFWRKLDVDGVPRDVYRVQLGAALPEGVDAVQ